jgi:hypothetical protein
LDLPTWEEIAPTGEEPPEPTPEEIEAIVRAEEGKPRPAIIW